MRKAFTLAEGASHGAMFQNSCKNGFTLAEVLITLGIIGIVAAMTLPALVRNYQGAVLKTQLDKAYSILSQALQKMQYDYAMIPNHANFGSEQGKNETGGGLFMNAFRPYFLSFGNCGTRDCIAATMPNDEGVSVAETDRYKNFNGTSNIGTTLFDDGQMIMADTMIVFIENHVSNILLTVDVNGINKRPNRWGHDLFTFQIDEKTGKLLPMGAPNTSYGSGTYCSISSNGKYNGIGCTYRALTEKDYFKNLPK